jgi:hypothetical protein
VNITNPYLGFNAQLNRVANDFGVQQWWQFTGQLILNELIRIQGALVDGSVDRRIYTAEVQDRAAALGFRPVLPPANGRHLLDTAAAGAATADPAAAAAAGSGIAAGVDALRNAGSSLMQRVAERMGLEVADLIDGLRAAGVNVPGVEGPLAQLNPAAMRQQRMRQQLEQKAMAAATNPAAATAPTQDLSSFVTFVDSPDTAAAGAAAQQPAVAPELAARVIAFDVPASSKIISQITNESEGNAAMLGQLNQGLAADRAAVRSTAAQDQVKQAEPVEEPVGPVLSQRPASG